MTFLVQLLFLLFIYIFLKIDGSMTKTAPFRLSNINVNVNLLNRKNLITKIYNNHNHKNDNKFRLFNNNNEQMNEIDENNINSKMILESNSDIAPEGYFNSDFNSLTEGKQTRVLLYIVVALLPCLFLVPFFMSRDFVPPIDEF